MSSSLLEWSLEIQRTRTCLAKLGLQWINPTCGSFPFFLNLSAVPCICWSGWWSPCKRYFSFHRSPTFPFLHKERVHTGPISLYNPTFCATCMPNIAPAMHLEVAQSTPWCTFAPPTTRVSHWWPSQATQLTGSCTSWRPEGWNAANRFHEDLEDADGDVDIRDFVAGDPGCVPRVAGWPRGAAGTESIHFLRREAPRG